MRKVILVFCVSFYSLKSGSQILISEQKPEKICPDKVVPLHPRLKEISGLSFRDSMFFAIIDGGNHAGNKVFTISKSGNLTDSLMIPVSNLDWEELYIDQNRIWIGDIGNNNGTRNQLSFYSYHYQKKTDTVAELKIINTNVSVHDKHTGFFTNRDFEAFMVFNSHIYLFSKAKRNRKCNMYRINIDSADGQMMSSNQNVRLKFWVTGSCPVDTADQQVKILLVGYFPGIFKKLRPWMAMAVTDEKQNQFKVLWQKEISGIKRSQMESVAIDESGFIWVASEASDKTGPVLYRLKFR